jgi:hypothetical protein
VGILVVKIIEDSYDSRFECKSDPRFEKFREKQKFSPSPDVR